MRKYLLLGATLVVLIAIWAGLQSILGGVEKPGTEVISPGNGMPVSNPQINFNETGNLTGGDPDWTLVYEKPGAPALTAKLAISPESQCVLNGYGMPCGNARWNAGDRATVSGFSDSGIVAVSELDVSSTYKKPGCPEYINCMPGPNVNRACVIPVGCEGYTQKAY